MSYYFKRNNDEVNCITMQSDDSDYVVIVCGNTTKDEHEEIKNELQNSHSSSNLVDIYYAKKLVSIYVTKLDEISTLNKNTIGKFIKSILPNVERNIVYQKVVYGSKMKGVKVTTSREDLKVTDTYSNLLTIPYKNK